MAWFRRTERATLASFSQRDTGKLSDRKLGIPRAAVALHVFEYRDSATLMAQRLDSVHLDRPEPLFRSELSSLSCDRGASYLPLLLSDWDGPCVPMPGVSDLP